MLKIFILFLSMLTVLTTSIRAQIFDPTVLNIDPYTATEPVAPVLEGLGDYGFDVTTNNEKSKYFFNQGWRLVVGFNHSEAMRSFKEAVRLDPENAMAYWGWALTMGPNLNLPMLTNNIDRTWHAMEKALSLKDNVSQWERDYIDTLAARYSPDHSVPRDVLDIAYMNAAEKLMNKYPDDLDAAVLYAAAAMNLQPWDYWNDDGTPKGYTEKVMAVLESVLERDPNHPAAHHYYIHVTETEKPELSEGSADVLAGLMPGSGHLIHMPSHIFMRVGRYQDAYDTNIVAANIDEEYIEQTKAQGLYVVNYYPHNVHFLSWSSMFTGRSELAISSAYKVKGILEEGVRKSTWGASEFFRSQPIFVLVRFGKWQELLEMPKPFVKAQFVTGMWHFGRGMAYLNLGDMGAAEKEIAALENFVEKFAAGIPGYPTEGKKVPADNLAIALALLKGEKASLDGKIDQAIYQFATAVRLEDANNYYEPAAWNFPTRHYLGALLLGANRPREAEVVYWDDLEKNPNNAYSLFGLYQSLLAQGKETEAQVFLTRYEEVWKDADIELTSSRF